MQHNLIETVMGAVVLVVAALFLFFSYTASGRRSVDGYAVNASFERVDGISIGSDVRLAGIKIGSVTDQTLDPKTYLATIKMVVDRSVRLPSDTSAEIVSSGLLGEKYLALVPGGAAEMLPDGGQIRYTQAPVSLEGMIGQLIFSKSEAKPEAAAGGGGQPGAANPPLAPKLQ